MKSFDHYLGETRNFQFSCAIRVLLDDVSLTNRVAIVNYNRNGYFHD